MSDVSRVPGDDAPDPAAVSTVEDLAVHLRILQIYDGKPSVRDIERRIQRASKTLPKSTIQDALKGNRGLPRLEVVLAIVEALGVTEPAPWRSAWTRAARNGAGLPPVFVASSPAPLASAAPAGLDVSRIATANEATAASLIEAGDVDEVTHVLAGLDHSRAASRLNQTAPERVALVLAAMDEQAAASIVTQMMQSAVTATFEAMPPDQAARILARITFDRQAAILHPLNATTAVTILQQLADWPTFLGNVHSLAPSDLVRFLAAMPPDSITKFFDHPNNNPRGGRVIAAVSAEDAALIIRHVPLDQAVRWLGALQPKELAAAIAGLSDDEVVSILQRLPQNVVNGRGRAFVEAFGEAELVRLLAQLPDRAIGEWLARLRGSLPTSSINQLTKIMREGPR